MTRLLLIFVVMLILHPVLSLLPAPINVHVDSHNFHHILRWDPGPGTPNGTVFKIYRGLNKGTKELKSTNLNTTSLKLRLNYDLRYTLSVQAVYNQTMSSNKTITFLPFRDTKISPAELLLSGCGNCIEIKISLPKLHKTFVKELDPEFEIFWRKAKEAVSNSVDKNHGWKYTLQNLERGEEYCIQVDTKIRTNQNTVRSSWKCTFTSPAQPRKDSTVLGAVTTFFIAAVGGLMIFMFCLYYSGFLGKFGKNLPRALIMPLSQGFSLIPEKIVVYLISGTSETMKQKRKLQNNFTKSHVTPRNLEEEEEGEEEGETGNYLNKNLGLSSGTSSFSGTNASEICKLAESTNSGSLKERPSSQVEEPPAEFDTRVVNGRLEQDLCNAKKATVSFIIENSQSESQEFTTDEQDDNEIKEKVNLCNSSGNVNLFSVVIAALTEGTEEKQNTRDTLKLYESEPLLATVQKMTSSNADSNMTESDRDVPLELSDPTEEDVTGTKYEDRHADTDEEEEVFSTYMSHT